LGLDGGAVVDYSGWFRCSHPWRDALPYATPSPAIVARRSPGCESSLDFRSWLTPGATPRINLERAF